MFKISHRQNVIRASVIGCLIVAVLSVAAYFIINQFGISRAAINPGDTVTIQKKPNTEVYRYGSKRESGHDYDGSMTRWYRVVAPDGTKYDGFCAQASNDDPRDKNKPAVEIPDDQKNGASIKLLIYVWQVNNTNTAELRNQIFSLLSKGDWSNKGTTVKRYLFVHAAISGMYDNDYYGLNSTEKQQVQQAATYLQAAITANSVAWQEASNFKLYYAVDSDSGDQDVVWIDQAPKLGSIAVQKCDYDTNACTPQGDATFAENLIQVYNASGRAIYDYIRDTTFADGALMLEGRLDGNGQVTFGDLPADNVTYRVVEATTNSTYNLTAPTEKTVSLVNDEQVENVSFYNTVKKGKLTVNKNDADTGTCTNLYGLSFSGIKFELKNVSNRSIRYNGSDKASGGVVETVTLADNQCSFTINNLPYGRYTLQEIATSTGYALNGTVINITIPTNESYELTQTVSNQPVRGNLKFVKKDPNNNNLPMAHTAFNISRLDASNRVIESHIIIADENGVVDTSKDPHTNHTNGYDEIFYSSEDPVRYAGYGIWFGKDENGQMVAARNGVGALPYGTYLIEELTCDSNKFCYHLVNEKRTVTINSHNQMLDLGDWNNDCAPFTLETEATDKGDEDHYVEVGQETEIKDHVSYCAKTGFTFTITGTLMKKNQETGEAEPYLVDGEKLEQSVSIKPTEDCGTLDMYFPITVTEELAGESFVVFERLYYKDTLKTVHEDVNDEKQTINVIKLGTVATDEKDGDHFIVEGETTTIVDTVEYCFDKGKFITISGVLMNKNTGEPLLINGEKVEQTGSVLHARDENCGTMELAFELEDTTGLAGTPIVVFETLYEIVPVPGGGDGEGTLEKVTAHEDIDDEDQTVTVINFGTYAENEETGGKLFPRDVDITVKDTVHYCLQPGKEYTVKGVVMDKATGNGLLVNSAPVEASVTFTPTEACGDTEMYFNFNTTHLGGARLVVFESLYYDGELIIEHKDINNDDESFEIDINVPETGYVAKRAGGTTETTGSVLIVVAIIAFVPVVLYGTNHVFAKRRVSFKK